VLTTFADLAASIKSPKTAEIYQYAMKSYMKYRKVSSLEELLQVDKTPKLIQSSIIEYLIFLKQVRDTGYSYRNTQLAAIKHFYRMNDFEEINWFKVAKYLGEHIKIVKDRAYTNEEIQTLLTKADERMRVVILLLASTGIRLAAVSKLKLSDLSRVEKYNLYQITIYANSKEEYYTFCSPEAAAAIDSYLAYRERYGEKLTPKSPLIREQFNALQPGPARALSEKTIGTFLQNLLARSGIVTVVPRLEGTDMRGRDRKDVARANGFRKKVNTDMIRSNVNPEAREMLLGHSIQLGDSYYRPLPKELLNEYLKAVDLVTINDEFRLKRKVETLTIRADKFKQLEDKMNSLHKRLGIE
jgi:integrase